MPKKQVAKGNNSKETWTNDMDEALVEAYLHQHNLENRSGNNFTTTAYEKIVKELEENFQREFVKEKVKDRWKNLKKTFLRCYDIFKNGSSGFGWDSTTKRWLATFEVWKKLLAENPEAAEWMNKSIAHYDKMVILYGKDRATGDNSETARELKHKKSFIEETQSIDTLDSDQVASRIEVNLDSFHDLDDENVVTSPEACSQGTSQGASSLKPKKKNAKDDKEFDGIREALHEVAQALKEGNEVYQKVKQPIPSINENQVWKLLEDLEIEEHQMDTTYLYLIDHPEKVRAVLGCPQDRRKKILLQMVFGPPITASVIDTTSSNPPRELITKGVSDDAEKSVQKLPEQKNSMKKPTARAKVPFEKGYSQMDWLKLTRSHPNLAGLRGQSNRRLISMNEVKQHQTEGQMWTVLKGRIYNLYPYMKFHPGGVDMLMKGVGKDCTSLFNKYHAWVNAEFLLEKCLVGILDESQ